jgi:hypothetical protein
MPSDLRQPKQVIYDLDAACDKALLAQRVQGSRVHALSKSLC